MVNPEVESFFNNPPEPIVFIEQLTLGNTAGLITDADGDVYNIIHLSPDDEMPIDVAKWLKFLTFTDEYAQRYEGDKTRFRDPKAICDRFLKDKGGRSLYMALKDGRPHALVWFHDLGEDSIDDYPLYKDAISHEELHDKSPSELATIASREYGRSTHKGLLENLIDFATNDHFGAREDIQAIVGRFDNLDDITDRLRIMPNYQYEHVAPGVGSLIMLALKKKPPKEEDKEDNQWGVVRER